MSQALRESRSLKGQENAWWQGVACVVCPVSTPSFVLQHSFATTARVGALKLSTAFCKNGCNTAVHDFVQSRSGDFVQKYSFAAAFSSILRLSCERQSTFCSITHEKPTSARRNPIHGWILTTLHISHICTPFAYILLSQSIEPKLSRRKPLQLEVAYIQHSGLQHD